MVQVMRCEKLNETRKGAASKYSQSAGQNLWTGGYRIIPFTLEDAKYWMEKHTSVDEYEAEFGEVEE